MINGFVHILNGLPLQSLYRISNGTHSFRLLIEDGKITGYMYEGDVRDRRFKKEEIPAKAGNQDGD